MKRIEVIQVMQNQGSSHQLNNYINCSRKNYIQYTKNIFHLSPSEYLEPVFVVPA
jgi:hypothetical protein